MISFLWYLLILCHSVVLIELKIHALVGFILLYCLSDLRDF